MALRYYYDLMSQPSRAIYLFLKVNKIPFQSCPVALRKGEHLTDEYANINPFKKVPAIDHDGFKLSERLYPTLRSRYLTKVFRGQINDHWYPEDQKKQARVDEYMAWQHANLRANGSLYFITKFIEPTILGKPMDNKKVERFANRLQISLNEIEEVFLKGDKPFLCGDNITIADLLGSCEVEQPRCVGYDVYAGHPKVKAWMERVRSELHPYYDEAHVVSYKLLEKFGNAKL